MSLSQSTNSSDFLFFNPGIYSHVHKSPILNSVLRKMNLLYSFCIKSMMKFIIYQLCLVLQMFSFLLDDLFKKKKVQFEVETKDEIVFVIRRHETY